jgi:hypothetical protein
MVVLMLLAIFFLNGSNSMHGSILLFGEWTFFRSSLDSGKVLNLQISVISASLAQCYELFIRSSPDLEL